MSDYILEIRQILNSIEQGIRELSGYSIGVEIVGSYETASNNLLQDKAKLDILNKMSLDLSGKIKEYLDSETNLDSNFISSVYDDIADKLTRLKLIGDGIEESLVKISKGRKLQTLYNRF